MVYGVGWVLFSGHSVTRFVVIVFALVVAVSLGYVKFARGRRRVGPSLDGGRAVPVDASLERLSARVSALEDRARAAGAALGGDLRDRLPSDR
jgi:hypothetical protein